MTGRTDRRPVRVTIDGEAYSPAAGVLIVVRQDGGKVCLAEGPGVLVEDVEPPRVWTDGDVVLDHLTGLVWTRHGGKWHSPDTEPVSDQWVTKDVEHGDIVLRYQSGGDS